MHVLGSFLPHLVEPRAQVPQAHREEEIGLCADTSSCFSSVRTWRTTSSSRRSRRSRAPSSTPAERSPRSRRGASVASPMRSSTSARPATSCCTSTSRRRQIREIERGLLISEEILRHLVTVLEDRGELSEEDLPAAVPAARHDEDEARRRAPGTRTGRAEGRGREAGRGRDRRGEQRTRATSPTTARRATRTTKRTAPRRTSPRAASRSRPDEPERPRPRRGRTMTLNKMMIIGNLGADPELRYTPSGKAVAELRVAVNDRFARTGRRVAGRDAVVPRRALGPGRRARRRAAAQGAQGLCRGRRCALASGKARTGRSAPRSRSDSPACSPLERRDPSESGYGGGSSESGGSGGGEPVGARPRGADESGASRSDQALDVDDIPF